MPKDNATLYIRIPQDLKDQIRAEASKRGLTIRSYLVVVLSELMNNAQDKKKK